MLLTVLGAMLLVSAPSALSAQHSADTTQIQTLVLQYARSKIGRDVVIALDTSSTAANSRTRSVVPKPLFAKVLGVTRMSRTEDLVKCADARRPRTCVMVGAGAILWLSEPTIRGDTAFLPIRFLEAGVNGRPIHRRSEVVRLVRVDSTWSFSGAFVRAVS